MEAIKRPNDGDSNERGGGVTRLVGRSQQEPFYQPTLLLLLLLLLPLLLPLLLHCYLTNKETLTVWMGVSTVW